MIETKEAPSTKKEKKKACTHESKSGFVLPAVKPGNTLVGVKCDNCYTIMEWKYVEAEKEEKIQKPAKEKKEVAAPEPITQSGPIHADYVILQMLPVKDKPNEMELVCKHNDTMFTVNVVSTAVKVTQNLAIPSRVIGKTATIEFLKIDHAGVPQEAKLFSIKKS